MIWWLMLSCLAADCQPSRLFLTNGKSIWTECGWKRQNQQVVLKFSDQDFVIEDDLVDWPRTQALQSKPKFSSQSQAELAKRDWQALVQNHQARKKPKPVVLTNKILQERKQAGLGPRKKPKKPKIIRDRNIQKLQTEIRKIRQMQTALRMQLRSEITWRQAQHLVAQIDILEKRWREKQYWLNRFREAEVQKSNPKKPLKPEPSSDKPSGPDAKANGHTLAWQPGKAPEWCSGSNGPVEMIPNLLYNRKIRATLISCYTYFHTGVHHGQSHTDHRGSRA